MSGMVIWQADELDEYAGECYDRTNEILFTDILTAQAYCEHQWRKEAEKKGEKSKPSHKGVPGMFARPIMTVGPYPTGHEVRWISRYNDREYSLEAFNSLVGKFLATPYEIRSRRVYSGVPDWNDPNQD